MVDSGSDFSVLADTMKLLQLETLFAKEASCK